MKLFHRNLDVTYCDGGLDNRIEKLKKIRELLLKIDCEYLSKRFQEKLDSIHP